MNLAFFSSLVPSGEPESGFEIANQAIVDGLRALGHRVSIFGFRLPRQPVPADPDTHVIDVMNIENAQAETATKLRWLLMALRSGLPVSAAKLTSARLADIQSQLSVHGPFDAHIFNSYQMAAAFPKLMSGRNLYVSHNVEHRSAAQNAASATGFVERYLYARDARLLEKLEAKLCEQVDYVWTLSDTDLDAMRLDRTRSGTLALTTPMMSSAEAQSVEQESCLEFDLGLIGTWTWQPNLVGLTWFLDEVVPKLPPDITVAIAGSVPEDIKTRYGNVQFLGRVPSASEFLKSARVVPLVSRGGTGVQLKTIEAFQAGLACVATHSSLRGVNVLPGNCRKAEEPQAFADAAHELVNLHRKNALPRADGQAFYEVQNRGLLDGLQRGLKFTVSKNKHSR